MGNNPIRYSDPSGHCRIDDDPEDCLKPDKSNAPTNPPDDPYEEEREKQDELFALIFAGSGENGTWTSSDWEQYYANRNGFWSNPDTWINPDQVQGWELFVLHVRRLASNYGYEQKDQFVRDLALLFAGVPSDVSPIAAAMEVRHGPVIHPILNYSNTGLGSAYVDRLDNQTNQSHHYAGIFFLAYFETPIVAHAANFMRDPDNPGDINLGNAALIDAWSFRQSTSTDLGILADMISALIQP